MPIRYRIPAWAALAIALAGCRGGERSAGISEPSPQEKAAQAKSKASAAMPAAFWNEFQSALRARDARKVADMTRFPADIGIAGIEGFEGINQREGFIRNFDTLFPKEAVETLLAAKASDLKSENSNEAGKGESYWVVIHDHADSVASEKEWTIGYAFSRQPDGSVKLAEVGFAG